MMLILTEFGGLGEEGQEESESGEPVLVSYTGKQQTT